MLAGKIRKSVNIEDMGLAEVALLQLFQQPGHLISGVFLTTAAKAVVGFQQKRKLFQLLGKSAVRLL